MTHIANTYVEDMINIVDELGNVVPSGNAIISFLRPAYDADKKTHVYKRATNLSTSDQVYYNDLTFGSYIHYISSTTEAFNINVIYSRSLVVATYSPY
jgi:hypothetical protein